MADEDYALAAALRDQIRELQSEDPEAVLRSELQRAVEEERFEASDTVLPTLVLLFTKSNSNFVLSYPFSSAGT